MAYSYCFSLVGKSRFSRFPPKKSFITSTTDFKWRKLFILCILIRNNTVLHSVSEIFIESTKVKKMEAGDVPY